MHASAPPASAFGRWHRLPVPVRRALVKARRVSHGAHRAHPRVTLDSVGPVAVITFDDGKVNAISQRMCDALSEALDRVERDPHVKAVVLAGRPGQFSAGFDLDTLAIGGPDRDRLVRAGWELIRRLYSLPLPVVTACTGNAVALGAALLLMGDLRLAAQGEFRIGFNEAAIGLPLPGVLLMLVAERLSDAAFEEATAGARLYAPQEAMAVGFVERVVAPSDVVRTAISDAASLGSPAFREEKAARIAQQTDRIETQLRADFALLERIGN